MLKKMIDSKGILIVFHGDFKIINENNISGADNIDNHTNDGEEAAHLCSSNLTMLQLCWEVFDTHNKKSLSGVQTIQQDVHILIILSLNSFFILLHKLISVFDRLF